MRSASDFTVAVRRGRRSGRKTLVVHLNTDPGTESTQSAVGPARVGFVVSKAVGSAVVRNRVKRQLRHLTRERLAEVPAGSLLVVRANPAAAGASPSLAADLDGALGSVLRRDRAS